MARQLVLLRHASVGPEYAGRYMGRSDVAIDPGQTARVRAVGEWLCGKRIGRCVCSPMLRARQTAEIVAHRLGRPVEIDPDLREVDFGRWEGKTFAEIAQSDPEEVERWSQMQGDFCFPQGESLGGFLDRVGRASARLAGDSAEVVLAITHGGVMRSMICQLLGLQVSHYILFSVQCASCSVIDLFDGKGLLSGLNQPAMSEVA